MNNSIAIPQHIGFIMDGNATWAKNNNISLELGYRAGFKAFFDTIINANNMNIKYITCYVFSSENWLRPQQWLSDFFNLAIELFNQTDFLEKIMQINCKIKFIGNLAKFPSELQAIIYILEQKTKNNNGIIVCCAASYGGRDEIVRAAQKVVVQGLEITEQSITDNLDTIGIPDPDLIIRTSGKQRLSNFMLWQTSYSEFFSSKLYWPDFDKTALEAAITEYGNRIRTFGA